MFLNKTILMRMACTFRIVPIFFPSISNETYLCRNIMQFMFKLHSMINNRCVSKILISVLLVDEWFTDVWYSFTMEDLLTEINYNAVHKDPISSSFNIWWLNLHSTFIGFREIILKVCQFWLLVFGLFAEFMYLLLLPTLLKISLIHF